MANAVDKPFEKGGRPYAVIGDKIKEALKVRGMTQAELAEATKIPKATLNFYVNGSPVSPIFGFTDYYFSSDAFWVELMIPYTVTKEAGGDVEVTPYASNGALNSIYVVNGHEVTINYTKPCKLGYLSGGKYVQVPQYSAAGTSHLYIVPDDVDELVLVLSGDANLDGSFTNADSTRTKAMLKDLVSFTPVNDFAADVNGDGKVSNADTTRMKAVMKGNTDLSW